MAARAKQKPTAPPVFDLATRYAAPEVDVIIHDPAQIGLSVDTGMRVSIASLYSNEARDAILAAPKVDVAAGGLDASFLDQVIAVTRRWTGFTVAGADLACTPENIRAIYTDPRTEWVYKQVLAVYLDIARFFGKPKAA